MNKPPVPARQMINRPASAVAVAERNRLVKEALGNKDITFGMGGHAPALPGSGLGVSINPQAVERVTQHQEVFLG